MTTIYKHRKSDIGSNNPTQLETGELAINLASGKTHTTRVLNSGTFIGTVRTVAGNVLTLTNSALVAISIPGMIAVRTTASGGPAFAPNVNTAVVDGAVDTSSNTITVSSVTGRDFGRGDLIWLVDTSLESEQVLEISGHSSASNVEPLNPSNGDIWVDISARPSRIRIYDSINSEFVEFVSGGGGGSSGFTSSDLRTEDSDTEDLDFGEINVLSSNTALATTYSAVDYSFGGIRSPRPGPNFGVIS